MPEIDVLIITALKDEFDAACGVASANASGYGVAEWKEDQFNQWTRYLYGRYIAVVACTHNQSGLHSAAFSARIICIYNQFPA
jgi:hypothetical protein